MRTLLKRSFIFLLLLFVGTLNHLILAQDQALKVIYPAGYKSNNLPFSPAVLADGTLYVSGQEPYTYQARGLWTPRATCRRISKASSARPLRT